ncbi:MAG TPA: HEAT repeat domain-containing protein [Kamptonema sp.]|nr:HEAT repeat domain-containing protein [Kamptonema sp.]
MKMVVTSILYYLDRLQDVDYLATIVNSVSSVELCKIINELLQSEDNEIVSSTCLFIRDLVLFSSQHPDCKKFVEGYSESAIVKTLEKLLFSPNHFVRKEAVYTLGKTCSYGSIQALNQAFIVWRDTDPILLPILIGEMGWLGTENFGALLESTISSQVYMTRWAIINVLADFMVNDAQLHELFQAQFRFIEQLRQDSNTFIKSEAEYEYQLLKFRSEIHNLLKAERKKKRKDLERQYKPAFTFASISNRFTYYLGTKGLTQYSVDELELFISDLTHR